MTSGQPTYISTNGTLYIAGGKDANCTLSVCPIEDSIYGYRPSIAASGALIGLYAICMVVQTVLGWRFRSWGYMSAMVLGCIDEILGYAGRILLWQNPWGRAGFIMQIGKFTSETGAPDLTLAVLITIGPVFFSAAIYVMLYQIVNYISPRHSRFRPSLFYYIFIPCDIVSLVLQAAGGAQSATATDGSTSGVDIALAGLAFQVATLSTFVILVVDFLIRSRIIWTRAHIPNPFKIFASALSLATLLILARCCYRIYELQQGYTRTSKALRNQNLFIGLESVLIVVSAYLLIAAHPAFAFKEGEKSIAKTNNESLGETKSEMQPVTNLSNVQ